MRTVNEQYYSQDGQDKYILETFFPYEKKGVFVDIGANDGITFSNTYAFEKRGWTGYCIEPLDKVFPILQANRPGSMCIQAVISDFRGKTDFLAINGYCEMLSGEMKKYDPRHLERIEKEIAEHGGTKKLVPTYSYRFEDLIKLEDIDYLSIDVEGGELDIIQSIDFKKYYVKVLSVENNYHDVKMADLIESYGFHFVNNLGRDNIFLNANIR